MANYQVKCVKKPNRYSPHERITHLGGITPSGGSWYKTSADVIRAIEYGDDAFYTNEGGSIAWLRVRVSAYGNKYLQTYADNSWCNNLLSLVECVAA